MNAIPTRLTGEVVRAGDPGYEVARVGWNRLHSRYPDAIVFCTDAQDVVNAVTWAREERVALRARHPRSRTRGTRKRRWRRRLVVLCRRRRVHR